MNKLLISLPLVVLFLASDGFSSGKCQELKEQLQAYNKSIVQLLVANANMRAAFDCRDGAPTKEEAIQQKAVNEKLDSALPVIRESGKTLEKKLEECL